MLDWLIAEVDRLTAERDDLPRFADGVLARPGEDAWHPGESEPGVVTTDGRMVVCIEWGAEAGECYSTQEAAEAAREEG